MPASLGIWRAHIGFAQEVTYGTTVATASVFIPAQTYDTYEDMQGIVLDEAMRAAPSRIYGAYTGMREGRWAATMPFYPNQTGRFLSYFLSNDTIGSSSNANGWQHNMILNSSANPHSDTIFHFFGSTTAERMFAGAAYESLDLKFSRASGMMTAKVAAKSFSPSTAGISEQAPSYTSDPPFRGWQAIFSVGATTRATLLDYELNIKREIDLVFAANNSQNPVAFEAGKLEMKFKLKMYGSTEEPYTDYRALTQQQMSIQFLDTVPGTTSNLLQIVGQKAVFTKVNPNHSGKFLTYDIEGEYVHNTSAGGDSGPAQFNLTVATSSQFST